MKRVLLSTIFLFIVGVVSAQSCNTIYVSPTGSGLAGTKASPTTLLNAFTIFGVDNSRNYIIMEEGVYAINQRVDLPSGVTIDGGYTIVASEWVKSSSAISTLNIDPSLDVVNVGGTDVGVYVGFALNNVSNVAIKDIDLNVLGAGATGQTNNRGRSIYGIHINNSGDYTLNRISISTGDASTGANGAPGAPGAPGMDNAVQGVTGSNGGNNGNATATRGAGGAGGGPAGGAGGIMTAGSLGTVTSGWRTGGNGGGGGSGGWSIADPIIPSAATQDIAGFPGGQGGANGSGNLTGPGGGTGGEYNCSGGGNGGPGNPGINGTAIEGGVDYPAGNRPNDISYGDYFVPGAEAGKGGDGEGGTGGSGGGGGGPDQSDYSCWTTNCGTGSGGGGGGAGGQGGEGGYGGYGGGSTFGIYGTGSLAGESYDINITTGAAGAGGNGGTGGTGGTGANGKSGGADLSDVGGGGTGGKGGDGAQGGRGQDGANGVAEDTYNFTIDGSSSLSATITANYFEGCTNSRIDISKTSGSWNLSGSDGELVNDLSPFTTSFNSSMDNVSIYFTTTGNKDLAVESENFKDFITIRYTRDLPTIDAPATVCAGNVVSYSTTETADEYNFVAYDAFGAVVTSAASNSLDVTFPTAGTYYVKLEVKNACCGWSLPVWETVSVGQDMTYQVDYTLCQGDSVMLEGAYQTAAGTYTDTYTSQSGCDSIVETTVTMSSLMVDMDDFIFDSICTSSNAIPLPFANPAGGVYSGTGVSGTTFDPNGLAEGSYDVTYTYQNGDGCEASDVSSILVVDCAGENLGIDDLDDLSAQLFPNPTNGVLNITLNTQDAIQVELFDLNGRKVSQITIQSKGQIDMSGLEKGTYLLKVGHLVKSVVKQ